MNRTPESSALWRQLDLRAFYDYATDTPSENFGRFSSLVDVWQKKKAGRPLPAWSDFDFYDFVGWHGWLSVYEIRYDTLDWTCRLSGTEVDRLSGVTYQGKSKKELHFDLIADEALEFYQHILSEIRIGWTTGPVNKLGREHVKAQFLELPCSNDGVRVDHTIEALISNPEAEKAFGNQTTSF